MADYTLAVGTHDPQGLSASCEADAVMMAVDHVESRYTDDLEHTPEMVVTLLGPEGLITRPSERLDEFVKRRPGPHPAIDSATLQPGDTNSPDCNSD